MKRLCGLPLFILPGRFILSILCPVSPLCLTAQPELVPLIYHLIKLPFHSILLSQIIPDMVSTLRALPSSPLLCTHLFGCLTPGIKLTYLHYLYSTACSPFHLASIDSSSLLCIPPPLQDVNIFIYALTLLSFCTLAEVVSPGNVIFDSSLSAWLFTLYSCWWDGLAC